MKTQNKRQRKYTGVMQYFHNFEHDPEGLHHCESEGQYPYTIEHKDGKHVISAPIARGHGRGCNPQWFRFTERTNGGYDMASGERIDKPSPPRRINRSITKRASIRITPRTPKLGR